MGIPTSKLHLQFCPISIGRIEPEPLNHAQERRPSPAGLQHTLHKGPWCSATQEGSWGRWCPHRLLAAMISPPQAPLLLLVLRIKPQVTHRKHSSFTELHSQAPGPPVSCKVKEVTEPGNSNKWKDQFLSHSSINILCKSQIRCDHFIPMYVSDMTKKE